MVLVISDDEKVMKKWRNEIVVALQQKEVIRLKNWSSDKFETDPVRLARMKRNLHPSKRPEGEMELIAKLKSRVDALERLLKKKKVI